MGFSLKALRVNGLAVSVIGLALLSGISFGDPSVANAAPGCVRLLPNGGGEIVYNACSQCRVVGVSRKRNGIAIPVSRKYTIPARSQFPLPFKGPGRTRITFEEVCEGDVNAAKNLAKPQQEAAFKQEFKCVSLERGQSGAILVNSCRTCRAAAIVRQAPNGGSMGRQAYKLKPGVTLPVLTKGAASIGLLAEIACPS